MIIVVFVMVLMVEMMVMLCSFLGRIGIVFVSFFFIIVVIDVVICIVVVSVDEFYVFFDNYLRFRIFYYGVDGFYFRLIDLVDYGCCIWCLWMKFWWLVMGIWWVRIVDKSFFGIGWVCFFDGVCDFGFEDIGFGGCYMCLC